VENSAGNLVKNEGLLADLNRVAGVCSTLVSHHPIGALSQHVYELSFSFIPP
jgi:hypothetical protein